jgi:hypothetical protein
VRTRRLVSSLTAALAVLVLVESPSASDLTITGTFSFRDNRSANSFGGAAGDLNILGAVSITPSGAGTSANATQGATTINLTFLPFTFFPNNYSAGPAFNAALTGPWSINATDASGTLSAPTPSIASPQLLPFVTNIQILGGGLTPTITWTLPNFTGFDPDRILVRVLDVDRNVVGSVKDIIFDSTALSTATTSFVIPPGLLQGGRRYAFDIIIDDRETPPAGGPAFTENRSETFSAVYTAVPEPGSLALLATGLGALLILRQRSRRR